MKRDQIKDKAQKHTETMHKIYSKEIKNSVKKICIYGPSFKRDEEAGKKPVFSLEQSYTQDSIIRHAGKEKIAVLNFASYRHPGGGFLGGSIAQEEALCHSSFLYNVLREFPDYYKWNEAHYNMGLYANRALYSPDVFFFGGDGIKHVTADVITCAAPNRSALLKNKMFAEKDNKEALKDRIRFVRDICDDQDVEILIAGAYGCGVFAQKPEVVAALFKECFNDTKVKKVIFAVPRDRNYPAFKKVFG